MSFVRYVASNVKGGISCLLSEKTLIVGPNGSGKSAVVNALELALGGFASDIAGRESVNKDSELMALAPDKAGELFSRVVLDDGTEAKWIAGQKGGKKSQHAVPPSVIPDLVFPLLPVRDAIRGNATTARKFFLNYALPNMTSEEVLKQIPESLHVHYRTAVMSADLKAPACDKLLLALEYAEKHARTIKAKAKGQSEVASVVSDGLAPVPTDEVQAAVKKAQKDAQKLVDEYARAQGAADAMMRIRTDVDHINAQLQQAESNIAELQQAINKVDHDLALTPRPVSLDEHTQHVIAIVHFLAQLEHSVGLPQTCPVCKTGAPHGTFLARHQQAQSYLAAEQSKSAPYEMVMSQRQQLMNNIVAWQTQASALRTQLNASNANIAAGTAPTPSADQIAIAKASLQHATDEITRIETVKAQWDQAKRAQETAKDTEKTETYWADLRDACKAAVTTLMDEGVNRFISKVQSFLPATDRFNLQLHEDKKIVFRFGLQRKDVLHTALSGAEWARVMGAIAGACADPSKLSVLIPEERAFDGETLYRTLEALSKVPGQIILTVPNWPVLDGKAAIPPGWTYINTAQGQHRNGELKAA